jgi:hypothetical protein
MLQNSPKHICDFKFFSGGYTPGTPLKRAGKGREGREERKEREGEEEMGGKTRRREGGKGGEREEEGREGKFRTPISKVTPLQHIET